MFMAGMGVSSAHGRGTVAQEILCFTKYHPLSTNLGIFLPFPKMMDNCSFP